MATLMELVERVESAKGADADLDMSIMFALAVMPDRASPAYPQYAYTSSLDAAMTLVPDDWTEFSLASDTIPSWRCDLGETTYSGLYERENQMAMGRAATPALAVTAASLRAKTAA